MKKRIYLFSFCLLLGLPFAFGAASSGDGGGSAVHPLDFLLNSAVSAVKQLEADAAEPPKVIDRITDPDAYPDFSFSDGEDLLDIWFPIHRDQDAAIFRYQSQVWMLDCGDERAQEEIVPLLQFLGIGQVDRLINTHPHHDHLNGLYAIDAAVPVRELMICFPEDATRHMTAAMEYCKGNGIPVSTFEDESILGMGDGFVTFLAWLKAGEEESINDRSAVFRVSYGDCDMLFTADIEWAGMNALLDALSPEDLKADLLRYPHHGKSAMPVSLFSAIDPALTIITNTTRIAELKESTKFLGNQHAAVTYTHRPPYVIHLQTDGRHWLCDQLVFQPAPAEETQIIDAAEGGQAADTTDAPESEARTEDEAEADVPAE